MTNTQSKRKRLIAGGVGLLLVAGVTAGGAFVTLNSTIFDNRFAVSSAEPVESDGQLVVTGDPLSGTFNGTEGELHHGHFEVANTSTNTRMSFDIGAVLQPGGVNNAALAENLSTAVTVAGQPTVRTGSLAAMALPGDRIVLEPGQSVTLRIDVSVEDIEAFRAAELAGSAVTVDFRFAHLLELIDGDGDGEGDGESGAV